MMEGGLSQGTSHTVTPSHPHTSHSPSESQPLTSQPHTVPTGTTSTLTLPEPHKHHKKKKKKKHHHKHSKVTHDLSHSELTDAGFEPSLGGKLLDDRVPATPTSEVLVAPFDREPVELRPLSPLSDIDTMAGIHVRGKGKERERERERMRGEGKEHLEAIQKPVASIKKIRFGGHVRDVPTEFPSTSTTGSLSQHPLKQMSSISSSLSPHLAPPSAPPTSFLAGKGSRTVNEAPLPKRRSSSQRHGSGKQLRLDEEEEEGENGEGLWGERERREGGERGKWEVADYDPPPMAPERAQDFQPSQPQPQGKDTHTHTHTRTHTHTHPVTDNSHPPLPPVMLSKTSLKMFLGNLLHLIRK